MPGTAFLLVSAVDEPGGGHNRRRRPPRVVPWRPAAAVDWKRECHLPDALTLPQLSEALGAPYRTLHSWVERDLVKPSVHRANGTGRANLFDAHDALTVSVLMELREVGVKFEVLKRAARELDERRADLERPVYLLVNGEVEIVSDADEAAAALARDGLTVAFNTRDVLRRVRQVFAS